MGPEELTVTSAVSLKSYWLYPRNRSKI